MKVPPSNTRWVILGLMVGVSSVAYCTGSTSRLPPRRWGLIWVSAWYKWDGYSPLSITATRSFNSRAESGAGVWDPASH